VPPYNSLHTAPFYRVDLRLEKRWSFSKNGTIAFIAEVQNVTLSKEQTSFGTSCVGSQNNTTQTNQCQPSTIGPLTIPSVGVEASF
jgi:hypothetical protein